MGGSYVYRKSEPLLWTVGFYHPEGRWHPESDHDSAEDAAARVHYLNGGRAAPEMLEALKRIVAINGSTGGSEAMVKEFKHLAETAIAKAEGRS